MVILGLLLPTQLPNGPTATRWIVDSSSPHPDALSTSSHQASPPPSRPVGLGGSVAGAPAASSAPQWVNVTPGIPVQPPARANASGSWDPTDGEYLLFGGEVNGQVLGDTWVFRGGQWATVHSTFNPAPRYGAGLAFDPVDNYTVLFGGSNSTSRPTSTVNDTWSFAQGQWTRLTPTTPPRGRTFPSMAFDPLAGRVIMFGGLFALNQSASTWGYVSGNWSSLVAGGPGEPPDRFGGSMAFDASAGHLIMFGGLDPQTKIPITLNDTWSFAWSGPVVGGTGTWTNLNLTLAPSTRYDAAMAYDASESAIVLFGGATLTGVPLGDTWLWSPTGWSKLSFNVGTQSPTVRYGSALAPSPSPGASPNSVSPPLLLFSGLGRGSQLAEDTWFFGSLSLAALPPRIDRPGLDVGTRGTVSELAFGGATPYTYSWNLLPPGCPAPNRVSFTCTPSVANTYQISATVKDALGASMTSTATPWVVNAPPSVAAFTMLPSPAVVSQRVSVNVTVAGGTGPFSFRFAGLPPGCASQNSTGFSCFPQATGSFSVIVNITDADNLSSSAHTTLTVAAPVTPGIAAWQYAVEGSLLLGLLVLVVVVLRKKLRSPSSETAGQSARAPPTPAPPSSSTGVPQVPPAGRSPPSKP
ncbi:MAG: hypothetical protein L3K07_04190 [Thermoplasmata archaeon]|nr:hypothetical protein [Thermoplasmata archaeon]